MMDEVALNELAADIKANGLHEAIKVDHTNRLLVDGRNRERACAIAGVDPRYERLPEKTDIFNYIVSINLRRRHLTDEQRREVVRVIAARNPDLSNRSIAKLAGVSAPTVAVARNATVKDLTVDSHKPIVQKTKGADGRMRPATGQISEATKQAIVADCIANPEEQKSIAERHGVSSNTVAGIRNRLRAAGQLQPSSRLPLPPPKRAAPLPPKPTIKELMEKRAAAGTFKLTREEKGMGTVEYGKQQAEGYPPGWTNDHAHVDRTGARTQIYTLDQIAEQRMVQRFQKILAGVDKAIQVVGRQEEGSKVAPITSAANAPTAADIDSLSQKGRDALKALFQRRAWLIRLVASYLDKFDEVVPTTT